MAVAPATSFSIVKPSSTSFSIVKPSSPFLPPTKALRPLYKFHLPAARNYENRPPFSVSNALLDTSMPVFTKRAPPDSFVSRFSPDELLKGADALVEALERAGVTDEYACPGGASMEIHQALTRSDVIRNIICRHEQGEIFAAEGFARISGRAGVCIATAGPGATNLVSGLADAMLDSVHLVAITGQVPRRMIGTNAFQEIPIVEMTRFITKHEYLVLDVEGIPRVVKEAFFLATSSRPGPVLIGIPKDIQQKMVVPTWDPPMKLRGCQSRLPKKPDRPLLDQLLRLVFNSKKPVLYVGGDCLNSRVELRRFVELTGIETTRKLNFWAWREELMEQKEKFPLSYKTFGQASMQSKFWKSSLKVKQLSPQGLDSTRCGPRSGTATTDRGNGPLREVSVPWDSGCLLQLEPRSPPLGRPWWTLMVMEASS